MAREKGLNQSIIAVLTVLIVAETVFFVLQYQSLHQMRQAYNVSEEEKRQLKAELQETKAKLYHQEDLFKQVLQEKEALNLEINKLKSDLSQSLELLNTARTEKQILADEARRGKEELAVAQEKLRILEGRVNGLDEVKLTLEARLQGLRELRTRIRDLRRETFLKKVEAQKELDRIKLEKGNRGMVIKDGQSTLTGKRAIELEKIIITVPPQAK